MKNIQDKFYLLLDYAIEYPITVASLSNKDSFENAIYHGLQEDELADVLETLFSNKVLILFPMSSLISQFSSETSIIPTKEEIKKSLQGRQQERFYRYGVTAQGGKLWEDFFQANWYFYHYSRYADDTGVGDAIGGSVEIVKEFLKYEELFQDFKIISSIWYTMKPYKATYWKTLSKGYNVHFFYEPKDALSSEKIILDIDADLKRWEDIEKSYDQLIKRGEWRKYPESILELQGVNYYQ